MKKLTKVQKSWLRALRSKKYKQGKNALRYKDRFCCLGVLCDLAVKAKVIPPPEIKPNLDVEYDGRICVLPDSVMKWAGLKTVTGRFENEDLAHINDSGKRFSTIANMIEKHAEELFT